MMRRLAWLTLATIIVLSTLMAISQPASTRAVPPPDAPQHVGVAEPDAGWQGSFSRAVEKPER